MSRSIAFALVPAAFALALGAAFFTSQSPARAFPALHFWHLAASGETNTTPKNRCGAGGLYGTGGPSDLGVTCAHCHIDGAGLIDLDIAVNPPFQMSGNDSYYSPGQVYDITATMTGEHLAGTPANNNLNGFAMSFEDPGGQAHGVLTSDTAGNSSANCPANAPTSPLTSSTFVYGDCHAVLFNPVANDIAWSFQWTAPQAGAGDLTVWWGVVDGDSHGESSLHDDVKQSSFALFEGT